MALLGQRFGVDSNAILQMVAVMAEGFCNPYYGTTGGRLYDGRCLPKDIKTFLVFAKKLISDMPLLSAVDSINSKIADMQHDDRAFLWLHQLLSPN